MHKQFNYSQSMFPQSIKTTGGNVEQFQMSTYQRIILFNSTVRPKNVSELILPDPKNRIRIM